MYTLTVLKHNLALAEKAIARLVNKAEKLGLQIPTYKIGQPHNKLLEQFHSVDGIEWAELVACEMIDLVFDRDPHEALIFDGWHVKGVVDRKTGVLLSHGATEDEFQRAKTFYCEHCKTRVRRNRVYLLSKGGEVKIVGSTCADDFTGVSGIANALACMSQLRDITNRYSDESVGGGERFLNSVFLMSIICMIARVDKGYMSAKAFEDISTIAMARSWLARSPAIVRHYGKATEEDETEAKTILAWGRTLNTEISTLEGNIARLSHVEYTSARNIGLFGALYASYYQTKEAAKKAANVTSEWVGQVKERRDFGAGTIQKLKPTVSEYGEGHLVIIHLDTGHVLKWFSSRRIEQRVGDRVTVKATITGHEEYQGIKQTRINRADLGSP